MEVGGNTIEFEVAHFVVSHHLGTAPEEDIKVFLVGELETTNLIIRVLLVPVRQTHVRYCEYLGE